MKINRKNLKWLGENKKATIFILVVVFIWFFNLFALTDDNIDGAAYTYYRFKYGSVINLDEKCFRLPDRWFMTDSTTDLYEKYANVDIGKREKGDFRFATILLDSDGDIIPQENSDLVKTLDSGEAIYRLTNTHLRSLNFWAKYEIGKLVMGESIEVVEQVIVDAVLVSCK